MRSYLVTGGTDGIGKAVALKLAGDDSHIIVIGRNRERGAATEEALRAAGGSGHFIAADLSTVGAMRDAASQVENEVDHLDAVIHAAGGVFSKRRHLTDDGLERTFAIQTLARFLLTNNLADLLHRGTEPRVLVVAAAGEFSKVLDLSDLQGERSHSFFGSMEKNGLANDLLTAGLIAHHEGITFFNYGPGLVRTKVSMPNPIMRFLLGSIGRLFSRTPEEAAADIVNLISRDDCDAGFYGAELRFAVPKILLKDPGLVPGLWEYCEEIVKGID